jgi:hypothetical protein
MIDEFRSHERVAFDGGLDDARTEIYLDQHSLRADPLVEVDAEA